MAGRRLTAAEHALIVLSVRRTGNVRLAQAFAAGYFFFVNDDDEANWLDSLMNANPSNVYFSDAEQISFPDWEIPESRSLIEREQWDSVSLSPEQIADMKRRGVIRDANDDPTQPRGSVT